MAPYLIGEVMANQIAVDVEIAWPYIQKRLTRYLAGVGVGSSGDSGVAVGEHALDGPLHTGVLAHSQAPWVATDIATAVANHAMLPDVHHARSHSIIASADHTVAGTQYQVIGLTGTNTLGLLDSTTDGNGNGNKLLRATADGDLGVRNLTAVGTVQGATVIGTTKLRAPLLDTASGNLSIAPAGGITAITGALTVSSTATVTTSVQTPLLTTASNVDLIINPAGTGAVQFPNDQKLRASSFDSSFPVTGWQINEVDGVPGYSALTIGKIQADELSVKVFVANETRVDRGNQFWTKSYGIGYAAFTSPSSIGGTVAIVFEDSPALSGAIFSNNDWLLFQSVDIDTGIDALNLWGQVSGYVDGTGGDEGRQTWTFTLRSGPTNTPILAGQLAVDFGASGAGLIHLSTIDAAGAPYLKFRTWAGANPYTPANYTTHVQIGHLGSIGNSYYTPAGYGLYIRSTANEWQFIVADNNGLQIRGADFKIYDGSDQTVGISSADGSVKLGTNIASDATTSFDFNGTTGALLVKGSLSAADGKMVANNDGLNIIVSTIDDGSWANFDNAFTLTSNPSAPAENNTVGQIYGSRRTGATDYGTMTVQARRGTDSGLDEAYLYLSAKNDDSIYGTAQIQLSSSATNGQRVWIFSQDNSGNSASIGLFGTTTTRHVEPDANGTRDLGTTDLHYRRIYVDELVTGVIVGTPSYGHSHDASDIVSGTLSLSRIPATLTGKDADTLDSYHASAFALAGSVGVTSVSAGNSGVTVSGTTTVTVSHADTSSLASVDNAAGYVIQDLTVDIYGHATGLTTVNLDTRYPLISDLAGYVPTSRTVTATGGLVGGGDLSADRTISHADTSSVVSADNSGTTFIQDLTFDIYGHVTAIVSADAATALDGRYVNITGDIMTGNLFIDGDAVGAGAVLSLMTRTSTSAQWQMTARAYDHATTAEQNDLLLTYYNGSSTATALHIDSATTNATFGGVISAAADTDANNTLGRAIIGYGAAADSATIAHYDHHTSTNYGFAQFSNGATQVNTVTGQEVTLSVNDVATIIVTADRLLPRGNTLVHIGDYNRKFGEINATVLKVQQLVAQEVISTIGGQILVSPTNELIADVSASGVVGGTDDMYTNMVAYWALDQASGTRLDSRGTNHLTDRNTVTSTTGKIGLAAQFDRANSERLNIADNTALSAGDVLLYAKGFVYPTLDDGNSHTIAAKGGSSGNRAWTLAINWAGSNNRFEFTVYSPADAATTVVSAAISINTWYSVEIWHNPTSNLIGLSVNGTETTAAFSAGIKDDTGNFTLGALSSTNHFTGLIDEFFIIKGYIPDSTRRTWLYNSGNGRSYTDIYNYGAGAFSLDVKYNNYVSGEFVHMFSAPGGVQQEEIFQISSSYTAITGGFRYSAVRNLNGTGPFDWVAGDALTSLGSAVGSGYINMTATSTIVGHDGPVTAYYVRTGMGAWDAVAPVVADGNLRSFVDYSDNKFGHAAGNDLLLTPELGFKGYTIDAINGLRLFGADITFYEDEAEYLNISTLGGIDIEMNSSENNDNRAISFNLVGVDHAYIKAWHNSGLGVTTLSMATTPITGLDAYTYVTGRCAVGEKAQAFLNAQQGTTADQSYVLCEQPATASGAEIKLVTTGKILLNATTGITAYADLSMNSNDITNVASLSMSGDIDMNGNDIVDIGTLGTTWTNLDSYFAAGWGHYGSGYANGQFKKVGDLIILRGLVKRSSGSSATIATLPSGYRPSGTVVFKADSGSAHARIDISSSGEVILIVGDPTNYVSLSGIVFSTL